MISKLLTTTRMYTRCWIVTLYSWLFTSTRWSPGWTIPFWPTGPSGLTACTLCHGRDPSEDQNQKRYPTPLLGTWIYFLQESNYSSHNWSGVWFLKQLSVVLHQWGVETNVWPSKHSKHHHSQSCSVDGTLVYLGVITLEHFSIIYWALKVQLCNSMFILILLYCTVWLVNETRATL